MKLDSNPGRLLIALLAVLGSIISVQMGAAVAKTLFPAVGPYGMTTLRTVMGAVMLAFVWRPWQGRFPGRRAMFAIVAYGTALGAMNGFFYLAIDRLPLGIAVAIEFVGPFLLSLAMSRRLHDVFWLALAAAGLAVLLPLGGLTRPVDGRGALFALAAGACWALYIVFGHRATKALPPGRTAGLGLIVAALVTLPPGIAGALRIFDRPALVGMAVGVALLSSALPYSLESIALKRLPPRIFSILMSLEPAMAALAGMLMLGERLAMTQAIAIACVMAASLGATLSARTR